MGQLDKFFILLIFQFAFVVHAPAQAWAQFHHTSKSDPSTSEVRAFGDIRWKYKTEGKIFSSPAVLNGVVYVGSGDHYLYAIDVKSGELKWKFETEGAIHSSPAVFENTVYFGSFDGHYYAVDTETGLERWKVKTKGEKWIGGTGYFGWQPVDQYMEDPWDYFLSSPAVGFRNGNLTIYFGSSDGNLYAVDARNGDIQWAFKTDGIIHTTPLVYNGSIYMGSWDTYFYAVDATSGKLKWKFKTGADPAMSGIQASATGFDGKIFFGARDAYFYSLDAATGKMIWKYDAEKSWILSTAAISTEGEIYVGTSDSFLLLALDSKTGKEKFRFKTNGYVFSSPTIVRNTAIFGDFTGKLFALDLPSGGKRWCELETNGRKENATQILNNDMLDFAYASKGEALSLYKTTKKVMDCFYSLGSIVSTASVHNNVVYVGSADGNLYAIDLKIAD